MDNNLGDRRQANGPLRKLKIGEWLQNLGLISQYQISDALGLQQQTGRLLGTILIEKGYISQEELENVLRLQELLSSKTSLTDLPIDKNVLSLIPESFIRQHLMLPLMKLGHRLVVASNRTDEQSVLDRASLVTGYFIVPIPFRRADLEKAVAFFFDNGPHGDTSSAIERAIKSNRTEQNIQSQIQDLGRAQDTNEGPIIELVNSILGESVDRNASDIHFEPTEHTLEVRFRVDGVLTTYTTIPRSLEATIITRIKVLCQMNITEKRRPQDGRFSASFRGEKIDFRVSSILTHWGEKLVLRLLKQQAIMLGLEHLGFEEDHLQQMERLLSNPTGIILVTGPTGSGKTTTLYAALQRLDRSQESIITIEDPVEYPLEGISQIQVNPKVDLTFASALRTILRLDPDVIMVGEIRDFETLETATNAAMTGHLVFSTIHTNDAASTIIRLMEMGIPRYVISSTLSGVIAQRLVRRICPNCKEEYEATPEEKSFLGVEGELILARGKGCERCNGTGFRGQMGLYELLRNNRPLQALINRDDAVAALTTFSDHPGFISMLDDGKRKARKHLTTVREVIRTLGYGADFED